MSGVTRCHTFPKAVRVRRRAEFLAIQRDGRRRHTSHFVTITAEGRSEGARLGVTVSSRVGNAVVRNRLKRIVREAFRQRRSDIGARADVVIIAKPGAERLSGGAASAEVVRALELALG